MSILEFIRNPKPKPTANTPAGKNSNVRTSSFLSLSSFSLWVFMGTFLAFLFDNLIFTQWIAEFAKERRRRGYQIWRSWWVCQSGHSHEVVWGIFTTLFHFHVHPPLSLSPVSLSFSLCASLPLWLSLSPSLSVSLWLSLASNVIFNSFRRSSQLRVLQVSAKPSCWLTALSFPPPLSYPSSYPTSRVRWRKWKWAESTIPSCAFVSLRIWRVGWTTILMILTLKWKRAFFLFAPN